MNNEYQINYATMSQRKAISKTACKYGQLNYALTRLLCKHESCLNAG